MAYFTPSLSIDVGTRCTVFSITDDTGVDTGDSDKWDGVSGLVAATVTEAIITVTNPAGTDTDEDVTAQIPTPVLGNIVFNDIVGTYDDGYYTFTYKVSTVTIAVTALADYSTTVSGTVKGTCVGHLLQTGMWVVIPVGHAYAGSYQITRIDADNFYFTATYDATATVPVNTITQYRGVFYQVVYCNAEAYISKGFADYANMTAGVARDNYLDNILRADGLLEVLKSAKTSSNAEAMLELITRINSIVEFLEVDLT